jgi:site-specific recombinase XerC
MVNSETALEVRVETPPALSVERDPAAVYLASLQPSGRASMLGRLLAVAAMLGAEVETVEWTALRYEHVAAIKARLQERGHAPASINCTLAALRGVGRAAWRLGTISAENYERIRSVPAVRGERLPAGRGLTCGEVAALLEACLRDETPAGRRDAAIIALLFGAGLRRSEAASVERDAYNAETGELRILGKGNKERILYLTNGAAAAVEDWLRVRGDVAGPILLPINKGGRIQLRPMNSQGIYDALRKRAAEARVKPFSPHDGRRSFISDLLDAGADIAAVQRLAGHADVSTTARYDRRGEAAKRKAASLLHLPYSRPKPA